MARLIRLNKLICLLLVSSVWLVQSSVTADTITQAKILYQTIKNGVTQVAQLENLVKTLDAQTKHLQQTFENFRVGNFRSANDLLNEMAKVESIIAHVDDLLDFTFSIDEQIERNLEKLAKVISAADYAQLRNRQQQLQKSKRQAYLQHFKFLGGAKAQQTRQKRLQMIYRLQRQTNNQQLGDSERQQIQTELLVQMTLQLEEIKAINLSLYKVQLSEQLEKSREISEGSRAKEKLLEFFKSPPPKKNTKSEL